MAGVERVRSSLFVVSVLVLIGAATGGGARAASLAVNLADCLKSIYDPDVNDILRYCPDPLPSSTPIGTIILPASREE